MRRPAGRVVSALGAPRRWSVARQTFALLVGAAVLVVGMGLLGEYLQAEHAAGEEATSKALAVARTVAATPAVVSAVVGPDPSSTLQPYAEQVRVASGTDFVVIMSPDGTRYTHPDPAQIGRTFIGHIAAARSGGVVVEDYTGTLGPSSRVVVPVRDRGTVVALVSVGIRKSAVGDRVRDQLPVLLLAGLGAAGLFALGTALVTRRVRRQTHGLGEQQLRELYEYHDAVLHAVTEGLVITDLDGRLRVANDEAVRLLGLPDDAAGRPVAELGLPPALAAALSDDEPREDELHLTDDRVLVLSQGPATWQGRLLGHVTTLRDRTDLEALTGELDTTRGLTEALRSQAHESANRLHTIVSLIELGHPERALEFATEELRVGQVLTDEVVAAVEEPALTALLLGKVAEAHERGVELHIAPETRWPRGAAPVRDLVTIVGNLIDNALDAVTTAPDERSIRVGSRVVDGPEPGCRTVILTVSDTGPGLPPGGAEDAFRRGWSTKEQGSAGRRGIGLALVSQSVERLGGTLSVSGPPGATFTVTIPLREQP